MKKVYILILLTIIYRVAFAQDIPMLMQRFQNNAFYNPAIVGLEGSTVDLAYQRRFISVLNNIDNFDYSVIYGGTQFILAEGKLGTGFNFFQEQLGLLHRLEVSAAMAYHTEISDEVYWSLGLKAAYLNNGINEGRGTYRPEHNDDIFLAKFIGDNGLEYNRLETSFGTHLKTAYFDVGISANRLMSLLDLNSFIGNNIPLEDIALTRIFPWFFTASTTLRTSPFGIDQQYFEGNFNFRRDANANNILDIGAYYIYKNMFTFGTNYRRSSNKLAEANNNGIYAIFGYTWQNKLKIAFAFELLATGKLTGNNLHSPEILLQYMYDKNESLLSSGSNNIGRSIGGTGGLFGGSSSKLGRISKNKSSLRSKSIMKNTKKERMKMRNYRGKYKYLLPPSKRN